MFTFPALSRPLPGNLVVNPLGLYSQNGTMTVNLTLQVAGAGQTSSG
jgi:hypothetical protein